MNKYATNIKTKLHFLAKSNKSEFDLNSYMGTKDVVLGINSPTMRLIAKEFKQEFPNLTVAELAETLSQLYSDSYMEQKLIGGYLLDRYPKLTRELPLTVLDNWLDHLSGWGEVDSLCQGFYDESEALTRWDEFAGVILKLSESTNINKRRASLVLLVKPARGSDERIKQLGLQMVEKHMHEREILITKAISWLLRELSDNHKQEITEFLNQNAAYLPAIALRETRKKILTGKK